MPARAAAVLDRFADRVDELLVLAVELNAAVGPIRDYVEEVADVVVPVSFNAFFVRTLGRERFFRPIPRRALRRGGCGYWPLLGGFFQFL